MTKKFILFFFCALTILSANLPVSAALKRFTSQSTTNLPAALTHVPSALAALKRSRSVTVPPALPETVSQRTLSTTIPVTQQTSQEPHQLCTWTPLHDACWKGDTERVKKFIKDGANVNARDLNGDTPLHFAAGNRRIENMIALVEAGAIVNSVSHNGSTPLHVAVLHGHIANVQELLSFGAYTKKLIQSGKYADNSPFSLALSNHYYALTRLFIDVETYGSLAATVITKTKDDRCHCCQIPFLSHALCISLCMHHDFCKKCIKASNDKPPLLECEECIKSFNPENLLIRVVANRK